MKITLITGHLAKERHGLLLELAEDWGELGAEVTILTGFPSRRITEQARAYYLEHPTEQLNERVKVVRVGSKKGEGNGLFSRFIKYLFLCKHLKKEAKKIDTDVFFVTSAPPFLGYICKSLKKYGKVVYNAQDLFPDTLFSTKPFLKWTPAKPYFRAKEKKVYKNVDCVITISELMKRTIASRTSNKNIDVVSNWSDPTSIINIERSKNELFDKYNINRDNFIVSYGGSIGRFQNWDEIIKICKRLLYNKKIQFVFFGNGARLNYLKKVIVKENLSNVQVLPMQPRNLLSQVYSFGDIELVSLSPGLTKLALPSKLYNVFSASRPVLGMFDVESEYSDYINNCLLGKSFAPNDIDGPVDFIVELFNDNQLKEQMGKNGHNFLLENCSRKKQTTKYYEIIKRVVDNKLL